ncbi:hypothetical protein DL95DRAFT_103096 [Leptodontidium sp. 2 PMI_412]|nr:hypothetical protein DL95DRAFT_103096 [Leptodontidium sp. 2 PMI_412]
MKMRCRLRLRDPYIVVVVVGWLPLGMSIRSIIRLILSQTYDVASITVATKDTLGLLYILPHGFVSW